VSTKSPTAPKSDNTRVYYIGEQIPATEEEPAHEVPRALLRTTNASAALRHHVTPRFVARLATADDIWNCAEAKIRPVAVSAEEDAS
jgi:hypothetical protein